MINFRNKLDVQLYQLMQTIDGGVAPLTGGEKELYEELKKAWLKEKNAVEGILDTDVPVFNKMLREKGVEYIAPKKEAEEDKEVGM